MNRDLSLSVSKLPPKTVVLPQLPRDIYIRVFRHLGRRDVLALSMASQAFHRDASFGLVEWRIEYKVRHQLHGENPLALFNGALLEISFHENDMTPSAVSASLVLLVSRIWDLAVQDRMPQIVNILQYLSRLHAAFRVPVLLAIDKHLWALPGDQRPWILQHVQKVSDALTGQNLERFDFARRANDAKKDSEWLTLIASMKDKSPSQRARALLDILPLANAIVWRGKALGPMLEEVKELEDVEPGLMAALAREMHDDLTHPTQLLIPENEASFELLLAAAQSLQDAHQAEEVLRPVVSFFHESGSSNTTLLVKLTQACLKSLRARGPWHQLMQIHLRQADCASPELVVELIKRSIQHMQLTSLARAPMDAFRLAWRLPEQYARPICKRLWDAFEAPSGAKGRERFVEQGVISTFNPDLKAPTWALEAVVEHIKPRTQAFTRETMECLASFATGMGAGEARLQVMCALHVMAQAGALQRKKIEGQGKSAYQAADQASQGGGHGLSSLAIMLCDSRVQAPAGLANMLGDYLKQGKTVLSLESMQALAVAAVRIPAGEGRRNALNLLFLLAQGSALEPKTIFGNTPGMLTFADAMLLVDDALSDQTASGNKKQAWKLALPFLEHAASRLHEVVSPEECAGQFRQIHALAIKAPRELHADLLVKLATALALRRDKKACAQVLNLCLALKPELRMLTLARIVLSVCAGPPSGYVGDLMKQVLKLKSHLQMKGSAMLDEFVKYFHLCPSRLACQVLVSTGMNAKKIAARVPVLLGNLSGDVRQEIVMHLIEKTHGWPDGMLKEILMAIARCAAYWTPRERDALQRPLLLRAASVSQNFKSKLELTLGEPG